MIFPCNSKDLDTCSSYLGIINSFNSNLGGDTFACHKRHLSLANDPDSVAFHCPRTTNLLTQIYLDALVNGFSLYELLQIGKDFCHWVGYCDLAGGDTIAGDTNVGLKKDTFIEALTYLAASIEVVFMIGNTSITMLANSTFKTSFDGYLDFQAIYLNNCGITSIHSDAFKGLT
jgi:hypothetical protein